MVKSRSAERASRIEIERERAVSIHIEGDAEVQCASGRVWLTQEGDGRDYCVPAGVTFHPDRRGRMVLVAVGEAAVVNVRTFPAGRVRYAPGTLRIDSIERLVSAAARARTDYLTLVARRMVERVKSGLLGLRGVAGL